MTINEKRRRPEVDDYESYAEFYEAVFNYISKRDEQAGYDPGIHIENGNELVRQCPHCDAPAIISLMSPVDSPSWRCVGNTQLADRHLFTEANLPKGRLEAESNPLLEDLQSEEQEEEKEEEVEEAAD